MIPVQGFEGQTVAVLGLGRSGLSAARALQAGGARAVFLAAFFPFFFMRSIYMEMKRLRPIL